MKNLPYRTLSIAALLLLLAGAAAFGTMRTLPHSTSGTDSEPVAAWREQIRTAGPAAAYEELLRTTALSSDSMQHLEGHRFGGALYEEAGPAAFPICGMELNGACLHEFVGRAIQDAGPSIIETLSEDCISRFGLVGATACQHGIGHGLVGYLGYTDGALRDALSRCATLTAANPIRGCYGGAFMEFTSRTMAENVLMTFAPDAPFALCDAVGDAYRPACYYWMPTWMLETLYGTARDARAYAGVGAYCERAPEAYADSCFRGLGYFAPPSAGFARADTRALCDAVSSDARYRADCWEDAAEAVGGP